MSDTRESSGSPPTSTERPLRLWPGVTIVALQWLLRFGLPLVSADLAPYGLLGGVAGALALLLWWLLFSRAPWAERLGGIGVLVLAMAVTPLVLHPSVATGAMGMFFYFMAIPGACLALVVWAWWSRRLSRPGRWASLAVAMAVACGGWALVRTGGITGSAESDLAWRWSRSPEERLLAEAAGSSWSATAEWRGEAQWPGFRGPARDGVVAGVRIGTDWSTAPPVELWRRPVGPAWSSFAVAGDYVYTQEQRGEEELVSCYRLADGEPVWRHADATRFWESNAGAGPRATPTLSGGRVFTLGGNGRVNALDARDGTLVWSADAAADTGARLPIWGFSGSPLVIDDLVVIAASSALVAYDHATGERRWLGPAHDGDGYSSPQRVTVGGVEHVVLVGNAGVMGVAPADGELLWRYGWQGYPIVQPAVTPAGELLVAVNQGSGTRKLAVRRDGGEWAVDEGWRSTGLKPYFNDFVVHEGHAYGFDGGILAAIDLADGERRWKGGRYGHGQLVLLADQDLLLVLSERGDLALVSATPGDFRELARMPAIEGKTWNHPVVVGDTLLVRNAEEMMALRLPPPSG